MIQFCTCNKRFSSPIEIPKDQESSKSCGRCGGILSVDEPGGLSRKMWSIMGPEFSLAIDPQLKWKTSSNGKHRALRRARIFTQDNGKKFTAKDTKDIEDLFDKVSKTEGDILVSESEKFGVSVLGRRFSDKFDKVPIKKRRLYLPPSQSNPHTLSSSGFNDHDHEGLFTVFQDKQVSFIEDASCIDASCVIGQYNEKCSDDEQRGSGDINEHIHHTGDCDDFSGISILAAAACHSSIDKGFMDAEGIPVTRHSSEENSVPLKLSKSQPSQPEHENIKQKHLELSFITGGTPHSDPVQTKFDECNSLVSSVGSRHSFRSKRKLLPSSGDRLNWDLNTVMDVWESQPEEFFNSDVKGNGSYGMEHVKHGLIQDEAGAGAGFGINKVGLAAVGNDNISQSFIKEIFIQRASPVVDCDGGKPGSLQAQVNESLLKEIQFTDAEAMMVNAGEKTNSEGNCERNCAVSANAHSVDDISNLNRDISTNMVVATEQHKHEAVNVSYSIIPGSAALGRTMNDSDTFSKGKDIEEMLHDDRVSIIILDSYDDHSEECNPAYVGKNNQLSSPHAEKHQPFSTTEPLNVYIPQQSVAGLLDQNTPGTAVFVDKQTSQVAHDGSSSKQLKTECRLDEETAYNIKFVKSHANVNQSIVLWKEISDNEKVTFRNACANQHEETSTDWKEYNESKSCNMSCESLNASSAITFYISPKLKKSISEGNLLDRNDISFADNVLISPGDCKTLGHVRRSGKDSLEEHYHSQHDSYAYSTVNDDTTGLEKVEILGDDDSQYEDGELRESVLNSWEEDEPQDVETEHVDYGSDCRDADCFEVESDLAVGTTDCTPEERMVSTSDGNAFQVTEVDSQSECLQKSILVEDVSNANGEGDFGKNIIENAVSKLPSKDENKLCASSVPTDFNGVPGKFCQPESSRIKSSGWDKLPRSENSAIRSVGGEYARRMTVFSTKRDLPNRVERSKSSEASCRKEVPYVMENRKHGQIDFNAERNANLGRPIGRTRQPFHTHGSGRGRDRGDCWEGSPEHHGSCRIDTSGCYSSSNFAPSGPTNAAAAAVAKVESNGFVVAPDGTIVKAGSMGSGSHLSRRSSKTSLLQSARRGSTMESDGVLGIPSEPTSNSIRGVSPCRFFNIVRGRGSRYGSGGMVTLGQRNKYHHDSMLESGIENLSLQHFSSRRQHSFSPHRRPMLVSHEHTRSPSRSRTQSPHTWTSPRGRDGGRMNGLPDVRRPSSRSPNFRTQRRILRHRSPQRHVIPAEDFGAYGPQSRSCSSPPHASRWFENERILQGQLHEHHQPRRPPTGGSSPSKIFSHSNRLDHSDPRGKVIKPDEYYQPNYSGRFSEYAGYNSRRGTRSRDGGRRGEVGRYDILHPEGHLESSGNMKCLRYESNGIRAHNFHRTKASGFQHREGPRTFYRSIDAQRENSPPRIKGEIVHFRHGRDGKLNADFKSFAVQNARDDMPLQRRPS